LAPEALLPWLDEAYVERAVFSPGPRVEVSATARLFTGATRRGVELRDRSCTYEYCDQPSSRCEVDHIVPHARGGPTNQDNGQLCCGFHNRLKERRPPPDPVIDP
jgi:5-methylcytosine-specific restriction endonuclease McrA